MNGFILKVFRLFILLSLLSGAAPFIFSQCFAGIDGAVAERRVVSNAGVSAIVFVDSALEGYADLVAETGDGLEVLVIDRSTDALVQMAMHLRMRRHINAIHVVSHGRPGALVFGPQMIDAGRLSLYRDAMRTIGAALTDKGDILLYGCGIGAGAAGRDFLESFSMLAGADVAASDDLTGKGGDWILEVRTDRVEAGEFAFHQLRTPLAVIEFTDYAGQTDYEGFTFNGFTGDGSSGTMWIANTAFPGRFSINSGAFIFESMEVRRYHNDATVTFTANTGQTGSVTVDAANPNQTFSPNWSGLTWVDVEVSGMGNPDLDNLTYTEDKPPVFATANDGSVSETCANGGVVLADDDVEANDGDGGETDTSVTYSLPEPGTNQDGDANAAFAIDSTEGTVSVNDSDDLDYESQTSHTITIRASDGFLFTDRSVTVNVTDESPVITSGQSFNTVESAPIGDWVGTVATTGDDPTSFSIENGNHGGAFAIDNSGQLTVAAALDASSRPDYILSIRAGDGASSDTKDVDIHVNDNVPPSVTSSTPSGEPGDEEVVFGVTFDESVSFVTADDFLLTATGTAAGTVASVSAPSGTSFDVTVNNITGDGTLRLDLAGTTDIEDGGGNNPAAYNSGDLHTVDKTPPSAPGAPDMEAASDTGSSDTDDITNDTTPVFTGTAEADATITVSSSMAGVLGSTTADGDGTWSFACGSAISEGVHDITANARDAAGNESGPSDALSVTIDTTPPSAPGTPDMVAASDTGSSDTDDTTNDAAPVFAGTAEPSREVVVSSSADGDLGSTTADGAGDWHLSPGSDLSEGVHRIAASVHDDAGNRARSSFLEITVDLTAPVVSVNPLVTSDTTPALTGEVDDAAAQLKLQVAGQAVAPANNGDGTWTLPDNTLAELDYGIHDIFLTATDAAGNSGEDATLEELEVTPDPDGDGVSHSEENAAPNGGDGNGDGIPDADQGHVASLSTSTGRGYMTLVAGGDCSDLQNVRAVDPSSLPPDESGHRYPFGLVAFELPCRTALVTITFHDAAGFEGSAYRKYGPTTPGDEGTTAWYAMNEYAEVSGNTWALDLADNRLGDDTGADQLIVDQGGPGQPGAPIPALDFAGLLVFAGILLAAGFWVIRRRPGLQGV
jgi:hypothetical protein